MENQIEKVIKTAGGFKGYGEMNSLLAATYTYVLRVPRSQL